MIKFPKWVPKHVAEHCLIKLEAVFYDPQLQIEVDALNEAQKNCIVRLTSDETMRTVWEALSKLPVEPKKLIEFLEFVRLHDVVMYPNDKVIKLSHCNQRKVMQDLINSLAYVLTTLTKLAPATDVSNQNIQSNTLDLLKSANHGVELIGSELSRLANHEAQNQQGNKLIEIRALQESLTSVQQAYGIMEIIQLLQQSAAFVLDAPPPKTPRKQASNNASRSLLIKDLKRYMRARFKQPLNQVIASTVITAMNLPPESVTEDQVRKA